MPSSLPCPRSVIAGTIAPGLHRQHGGQPHIKQSELVDLLRQMGDQAAQVEQRCETVSSTRDGLKTAITKKARETKAEVSEFMKTYLEDAEALDGLEFLSMAEAGEMAHWEILAKLNERAADRDIATLVRFAVPVQQRHVNAVREQSLRLAAEEDPSEPA